MDPDPLQRIWVHTIGARLIDPFGFLFAREATVKCFIYFVMQIWVHTIGARLIDPFGFLFAREATVKCFIYFVMQICSTLIKCNLSQHIKTPTSAIHVKLTDLSNSFIFFFTCTVKSSHRFYGKYRQLAASTRTANFTGACRLFTVVS